MSEEKQKTPKTISRREFLKDAGIVVGGTAVGSAFFLSACGKEVEVTKTVTTTAPGTTSTITKTAPGTTSTVTTTAGGTTQTVTKYTCPVCNQEFDSLSALKAHFDAEHDKPEGLLTNKKSITLTVNGEEYNLLINPEWTLQHVLREELGFTDVKDMCVGYGACGACSVLLEGRPVLSCMVLANECDGMAVQTALGIANEGHPIAESYTKYLTFQCGYCTPGFVVTAKALLDKNTNPSQEDIRKALGGNICRCGTYPAHIPAVLDAASKIAGGK